MKELRLAGRESSSLLREEELLRKLQAAGLCSSERTRLAVAGRWLFVDGFVDSLDEKLRTERVCCQIARGWTVVNRLRVAVAQDRPLS